MQYHYLLATETTNNDKVEHVAQYTNEDMEELFTEDERKALTEGEKVLRIHRYSKVDYIDMLYHAREAR